jgi:DNA polymerase (family 10)
MVTQPFFPKNRALADIFHQMADCYRFLGPAERFRAKAYENAAQVLHNMGEDIANLATDIKTLDSIGGIGEGIAGKIMEYLKTGRIAVFEELKTRVPYDLLDLMDMTGIGPATLRTLHGRLGVASREALADAIREGKLRGFKGFGVSRVNQLMRALKMYRVAERLPLEEARKLADGLLKRLQSLPGVLHVELAGSLRRRKATIGDMDLVMVVPAADRKKVVKAVCELPGIKKVLMAGNTRVSLILRTKLIQADIRLVELDEYGAAMLYFTGPREYNVKLRTLARDHGWKLNEYGLFEIATGKKIAGSSEESLFHALGQPCLPPEKRTDDQSLEQAA